MKIPLFDIDGTLLKGGAGNAAHRQGFDYAFQTVFGLQNASVNEIKTDGMIDKQILLEVVKLHGIEEEQAISKLDVAVEAIVSYYMSHTQESICVAAEGARELLEDLQARSVPLGLLTGNIEEIAMDKLTKAELASFFSFGAFGNLALKRVGLIEIARQRANKNLGTNYMTTDFIIIGDSPLDVACAKAGKIPSIGVGAANFTVEDLQNAGAELVVSDLREKEKVLSFLEV